MNRLLAILLIFGVMLQSMRQLAVIINFEVNKDYISKNLCENRDKPQMKCCGKCYLKKQLGKTENDNSKNKIADEQMALSYIASYITFRPFVYHNTEAKQLFNNPSQQYFFLHLFSVFHPPQHLA